MQEYQIRKTHGQGTHTVSFKGRYGPSESESEPVFSIEFKVRSEDEHNARMRTAMILDALRMSFYRMTSNAIAELSLKEGEDIK